MKNFVVLLMALALIGGASAQCLTGPIWGLANSENPYTFSTDADPFTTKPATVDCWIGWNNSDNVVGVTSGGNLTIDATVGGGGVYALAFVHDNLPADIGVTPGLDRIELVIEVVSITGGDAIVKIEQFPVGASFPNPDDGTGSIVQDTWDPDTTITGPGRYSFVTELECDAATVAVTPVIGVGGGGTIVIDEIWLGAEGNDPGGTKAVLPNPANNSIPASGSVSDTSWTNPPGTGLAVNWRFEKENATDGSGNFVYDPNWGAANGVATTMLTRSGTDKVLQNFNNLGSAIPGNTFPYGNPLADGLYSWRVDVAGVEGNVWLFEVGGDASPVVSQPDDQYMFLSQTDGDGDSNVRTFTVEWDLTDDGLSEITAVDVNNLNWGWDPDGPDDIQGNEDDERGIRLVSVVKTPDPVLPATITAQNVVATFETVYDELTDGTPVSPSDPNYQTEIMGYWDIRLEVTDGLATTLGTPAHHEIWDLCGEAAAADPTDPLYQTIYDSDNDCEIGLSDFQAYAALWLEQSVLLP